MTHKQTAWNKHLMAVYHQWRRVNKNITLADAMKAAKRSYKG